METESDPAGEGLRSFTFRSSTSILHFGGQLQVQVLTCASKRPAINWRFPQLFLTSFTRVAHRTQENSLNARLPIYYKRIQLKDNQMKEMPMARYGRRGVEHPPHLSVYHSPRNSMCLRKLPKIYSWRNFMEASLGEVDKD